MNKKAEALAFERLTAMEKARGAHFLEKHGAQLDLQWQFDRASGLKGYEPPSATRFFNSRDQITAIERAELIYERTGRKYLAEAPIRFEYPIGSGCQGKTLEYSISYTARTNIRSATGRAYTSFPNWNQ